MDIQEVIQFLQRVSTKNETESQSCKEKIEDEEMTKIKKGSCRYLLCGDKIINLSNMYYMEMKGNELNFFFKDKVANVQVANQDFQPLYQIFENI